MENAYTLNPNPLVQYLQKAQQDFTKADLIKYITENQIEMVNFRYVGADGRWRCGAPGAALRRGRSRACWR